MSRSNPTNRVIGNMSEAQLIALYAEEDRHPLALGAELVRAKLDVLTRLADGVGPAGLAQEARSEIDRRRNAINRLLSDNPSLLAALGR